jgi:hypothetical protein
MGNDEARMTNDEGMTKHETRIEMIERPLSGASFDHLSFGIVSSFVIRHSSFGGTP